MRIVTNRVLFNQILETTSFQSIFEMDVRRITQLMVFKANEFLIKEGTCSKYLYFITSGTIRSFTTSENGKVIPFGASRSFRVLGEVSSLWGKDPTVSVQATEECYCLAIDLELYREELLRDVKFLRYICLLLAEKVSLLDNNFTVYMGNPVETRLATFILQYAEGDLFCCSLSDCAEAIGTSYRHLIRLMNAFCAQKILEKIKRKYYIIDRNTLVEKSADIYAYFD